MGVTQARSIQSTVQQLLASTASKLQEPPMLYTSDPCNKERETDNTTGYIPVRPREHAEVSQPVYVS